MSANIENGSVVVGGITTAPSSSRVGLTSLPVNTTPIPTTTIVSSKTATTTTATTVKANPKAIPPPPPLPDLSRKRFAPTQLGTINNLNSRRSRSGSRSESPSDAGIVTTTTTAPTLAPCQSHRPSLTGTGSFNRPPRPSLDGGLATPLFANTTSLAPAFQRTLSPLRMAMPTNPASSLTLQDSQSMVGQYGGPLALSFSDTFMVDRPTAGPSSFRGSGRDVSSHSPDQPQLMGGYVKHLMPLPQTSDKEDSSPFMDAPPPPPRAAHHVMRSSSDSWATDDSDHRGDTQYDSPNVRVEGPGTPPPAQRYPSEPNAASRVLDKYHFMKTFTVQPKTPGSMDKKLRRLMVEPSVRNPQQCLVRRATRAPETPPKHTEETSPTFKRHTRYRFRNSLSPGKQTTKQGGGVTPHRVPPPQLEVAIEDDKGTTSSSASDSETTNQASPLAVEAADSALFNPPPPTSTQLSFDCCEDDDDFSSLRRIEPRPSQHEEGIKEHMLEGIHQQQMPTMSRALVDQDDFEAKPPQPTTSYVQPSMHMDGPMDYNDYKYLKPLTPARVPPPPSVTVSSSAAQQPQQAMGNPRRLGSLTSLRPVLVDITTTSAESATNAMALSGMVGVGSGGAVLGRRRVAPVHTIRNIAPLAAAPVNNPHAPTIPAVSITTSTAATHPSPSNDEMGVFVQEASDVQERRLVASCEVHARYILSLQRDLMMHHFVESFIQEVNRINAQIDSNTLSLGWWWRQVTGANDEVDNQRRRQRARVSPYGTSCDDNVELRAKCWYIPQAWQQQHSSTPTAPSEQQPSHHHHQSNVFENEWGTLDDSAMDGDQAAPTPERALFNFASF